jgi:hypothetical protein
MKEYLWPSLTRKSEIEGKPVSSYIKGEVMLKVVNIGLCVVFSNNKIHLNATEISKGSYIKRKRINTNKMVCHFYPKVC